MRIGVVACETFRRELEMILADDGDIAIKEYLEFGLHEFPEELKRTVADKVNSLQGKVDAVFLGYGYCQSLKGITSQLRVPAIMLEADDCVGVLLTSPEYEKERKKCAGTFYATPAFCEMGTEWFEKRLDQQLPREQREMLAAEGMDSMWFLRQLFDGYSRTLFIDTGIGNRDHYEALSIAFASKLNMRHECRCGTLEMIREGLAATKELARTLTGNETHIG